MHEKTLSTTTLGVRLFLGIIAVSFGAVFVRMAQAGSMPVLAIAAWRLIFACAVLLPYSWATSRKEIFTISRKELGFMAISGLFLGLHFACWIASLGYTSVASSVVLVSMGPLFVALGAWVFLREPPTRQTIFGLALAAIGSLVVGSGDWGQGKDQLLGDVLALSGAVFVAGYLLIGRKLRTGRSLVAYIAPVYGSAMLALLGIGLIAHQPLLGFPLAAYGWALALALVPQLIGHTTLNWALAHLSAAFVAVVTLAEPVGSSLLAWMILGEQVRWQTALGAIPIMAGICIASRAEFNSGR